LALSGNTLYGTTFAGGNSSQGKGTVFKVDTDGSGFAVLKHFTGSDGARPWAGLALSGNTLYGTTVDGGVANAGTLFEVDTDGSGFVVLKHFAGNVYWPYSGLALSGNTLYGTTYAGPGPGTVFKLELGTMKPSLNLQLLGNQLVLNWSDSSYYLQSAPVLTGIFTNIPGATSPYTVTNSSPKRFFRLIN
jgi:uncharacterized repeat protein (TIGR03803 family)